MSKGNKHNFDKSVKHLRGEYRVTKPHTTSGEKYVKTANMTITYENYNKANQADKQEWH